MKYEDTSRKVLKYNSLNIEFFMFFYYELSDGDTLTIQDPIYRGYDSCVSDSALALFQVIVDSLGSEVINSDTLSTYWTSATGNSLYTFGKFNEKMGINNQPFENAFITILSGWFRELRCYTASTITYQTDTTIGCELCTEEYELSSLSELSIYPNTSNGIINFTKPIIYY